MRILFLFLIRFYSLTLTVDTVIISEEIPFDDISFVEEDNLELPVVGEIEKEEEDENSKWYSIFVALPHSGYSYSCSIPTSVKFVSCIRKYILYLNLRI